jgi:hypothetical protein
MPWSYEKIIPWTAVKIISELFYIYSPQLENGPFYLLQHSKKATSGPIKLTYSLYMDTNEVGHAAKNEIMTNNRVQCWVCIEK